MPGTAVTAAYTHYQGNLFTRSAFIKADRWMVKIRVSGPEPRSAEVDSAMAALLAGLRFDGPAKPLPAMPISAPDCPAGGRSDARLLRDDDAAIAGSLLAVFDAAGGVTEIAEGSNVTVAPRIGRDWCRSILDVQGKTVTVLEATDRDRPIDATAGKSVLFVLYSDAGRMLEVVREKKHYLLLHHGVAEVNVLGAYDALPSPAQLRQLFGDAGEHGRTHARVRLKTNGDSEIELVTGAERK